MITPTIDNIPIIPLLMESRLFWGWLGLAGGICLYGVVDIACNAWAVRKTPAAPIGKQYVYKGGDGKIYNPGDITWIGRIDTKPIVPELTPEAIAETQANYVKLQAAMAKKVSRKSPKRPAKSRKKP